MSVRFARCFVAGFAVVTVAAVLGIGSAQGVQIPGVSWKVTLLAQPSNFTLSHHNPGEPIDQYVVVLTNTGSVASSGNVTLTDALPLGVVLSRHVEGEGWNCTGGEGDSVFSCVYAGAVAALAQSSVLTISVAVTKSGTLTNRVVVSGPDAPLVAAERSTDVGQSSPLLPPFELLDGISQASGASGAPDIQAGDHPFAITTALDFPEIESENGPELVVQHPKEIEIELPPGLSGNPQTASKCSLVALLAERCPPSSRVGTSFINMGQGIFTSNSLLQIYNLVPERGYPAEFGVYANRIQKLAILYASIGPAPEYRIRILAPDVPESVSIANVIATFFGDPQAMDEAGNQPAPFLTNPSQCSGAPLVTRISADSWEAPENRVSVDAEAPPVAGCNLLQFQPWIGLTPERTLADEPSGYTFDLNVPQAPQESEALATPPVKSTSVTLPLGVSLSASAADGLTACPAEGPEGINLKSSEPGGCPLTSQIGTAEARTPLLPDPLQGQLYVAQPGCGGPGQGLCTPSDAVDGNLFGLYLQLEGSGIVIKLHGSASANPATGQLTATFTDAPQQPFSDLKLKIKGGPRAPLANPQTCGSAITTSDITPWSSPETPDATPSFAFNVDGCEGSAFAPSFLAGTTNTAAGAYTSFSARFGRADRMQDLSALQVLTPPGLLGMLSHVTLCSEPAAREGSCSQASRIGTATAGAGAGSHPYWVSGPVYLTGPYNGAPFGLSVAIPAVAGPFNLGTVVVRSAININPLTSALTITSDPLPQIIDGVPLRVQNIDVTVDRPQFMFNPTNCNGQQITARIASAQGTVAQVASPFAAGGCKNLPFNPGFAVSTRALAEKRFGAGLHVKVTSAPGQANIRSVSVALPKQLPSRLKTIQQACPDTTFNTNPATCPPISLIGVAKANSPVLPVPLIGPAYLVSHGGAAFPDLDLVLQGEGVRLDLTGSIDIKKSVTSSTFASVPDAPISSFDLRLPAGTHSALTTNGSLCAKKLTMPTTIVGQNGRRLVRTTKVAVAGCPKANKPKASKARRARRSR